MKKFELTTNTKVILGKTLFQIRALVSFGDVEAGELGGWVEKDGCLDQSGDAWVSGNADVMWFSNVGSEFGTLTAIRAKDGGILISRG